MSTELASAIRICREKSPVSKVWSVAKIVKSKQCQNAGAHEQYLGMQDADAACAEKPDPQARRLYVLPDLTSALLSSRDRDICDDESKG